MKAAKPADILQFQASPQKCPNATAPDPAAKPDEPAAQQMDSQATPQKCPTPKSTPIRSPLLKRSRLLAGADVTAKTLFEGKDREAADGMCWCGSMHNEPIIKSHRQLNQYTLNPRMYSSNA